MSGTAGMHTAFLATCECVAVPVVCVDEMCVMESVLREISLSLMQCRHAVAAVKNLSQLSTVRSNIHLNSSKFIIERVASCHYKELASSNSKVSLLSGTVFH